MYWTELQFWVNIIAMYITSWGGSNTFHVLHFVKGIKPLRKLSLFQIMYCINKDLVKTGHEILVNQGNLHIATCWSVREIMCLLKFLQRDGLKSTFTAGCIPLNLLNIHEVASQQWEKHSFNQSTSLVQCYIVLVFI